MNRGFHYWLVGAVFAWWSTGAPWWVLSLLSGWAALACFYVGAGYFTRRGELFFKTSRGQVPLWMKCLLGPVIVFTHGYHWLMRRADESPPVQRIEEGLYLGRRLLPGDEALLKAEGITAILDVTVEFDGLPERFREAVPHYLNIPVYDHHVPRRSQMVRALRWIEERRRHGDAVLIHCALGQGRSVLVLLGYLMWANESASLDSLLDQVKSIRNSAKPNARQRKFLEGNRHKMPRRLRWRAALIFNPSAGRGASEAEVEEELEAIRTRLGDFLEITTSLITADESIEATTRKALQSKPEQVLVYGGDGTVSEVAACLMGSEIPLGILPGGTANALASFLFRDAEEGNLMEECCCRILEGRTQALDAGLCNGKPFFLLVGIGWEAGMVREASRELKARWGPLAYLMGGLEQLRGLEDFAVKLEMDGERHAFRSTNLIIANAVPQFSLFAQGSADAEIDDGWLNLTAVVNIKNRAEGAGVITDLIQRRMGFEADSDHLLNLKGKVFRIETDPPQQSVRDGELEPEGILEIRVVERALQVFV